MEEKNNGSILLFVAGISLLATFLKNRETHSTNENPPSRPNPMTLYEIINLTEDIFSFDKYEQAVFFLAFNTPSFLKKIREDELKPMIQERVLEINEIIVTHYKKIDDDYAHYSLDIFVNQIVCNIFETKKHIDKCCIPLSIWGTISKFPLKGPIGTTKDIVLQKIVQQALINAIANFFHSIYNLKLSADMSFENFNNKYHQSLKDCSEKAFVSMGSSLFK